MGGNKITLTNRKAGPDALLQVVEDRCKGQFEKIHNIERTTPRHTIRAMMKDPRNRWTKMI